MIRVDLAAAAAFAEAADRCESLAETYLLADQFDDAHEAALQADAYRWFERDALRGAA